MLQPALLSAFENTNTNTAETAQSATMSDAENEKEGHQTSALMEESRDSDALVNTKDLQTRVDDALGGFLRGISRIDDSAPLSILAYCLSSISMTVVNKYVVSGHAWNLTFLYLTCQAVVCTMTITTLSNFNVIKDLATFESEKAKKLFPATLLLVGMMYTSTKALQFLSVPVYTIFKNLTIIIIAYGEMMWFGGSVTPMALMAFILMVTSSIVAAWADFQNPTPDNEALDGRAGSHLVCGYVWMLLNVFCSASYVLGLRKIIKTLGLRDLDTMYYNNLLTIPVFLGCSLVIEEWSSINFAANFPAESRNRIFIGIVYSGLAAIFISYCSAWCIRVTTSTTYSMVGALNKLPLAISGLIFFSEPVTVGGISAIMMGFFSGLVYTRAKIHENKAREGALPMSQR